MKLTRKQSIDYLNKWINLYYNMAKMIENIDMTVIVLPIFTKRKKESLKHVRNLI